MAFSKTPVEAWGTLFPSIYALAMDSRCKVSYQLLRKRINKGATPQVAATQSSQVEMSLDLEAYAKLPQCRVTLQVLRQRVARGYDLAKALRSPKKGQLAAWGELFENLTQLSEDVRCDVPYHTLRRRILAGWPPGKAAEW